MSRSIHISELNKTFGQGKKAHQALKSVSFDVEAGEMVALIGASGSGKSTLMRHISGLTAADKIGGAGLIEVLGRKVQHNGKLYRGKRHERANTASIFQQFNLISRLSVLTNVCLGLLGRIPSVRGTFGVFTHEEKMTAMKALDRVGMAKYADQRASTLSGGQEQRVAIARALVQQAQVILADEPIASLDPASSKRVMQALSEINAQGISVIVSLHQVSYATKYCPRTIAMRDGEIVFDGESTALTPEFLTELYGEDSEELILGRKYTTADEDEFEFDEALSASAAG